MTDHTNVDITWDILDRDTIEMLLEHNDVAAIMDILNTTTPTPRYRADRLVELAIKGRVGALGEETISLCDWARDHGVRRIENALIELDRVLASAKRGEALLVGQALTRFIARHIDADVTTLKSAITEVGKSATTEAG